MYAFPTFGDYACALQSETSSSVLVAAIEIDNPRIPPTFPELFKLPSPSLVHLTFFLYCFLSAQQLARGRRAIPGRGRRARDKVRAPPEQPEKRTRA